MAIGQRKVWDARAHYKEGDHNASTCIRVCPRIDKVACLMPSRLIDGEDDGKKHWYGFNQLSCIASGQNILKSLGGGTELLTITRPPLFMTHCTQFL